MLAWPERLDEGETLTHLVHDLPREAQRIVATSLAGSAADLVERYARKALTVAVPEPPPADPAPAGTVRTVAVAWERRAAALGEIVELLDPASAVVWAADRSHADAIGRALPLGAAGQAIELATGDVPATDLVIAFDLPTAGRLAQLRGAGHVVLLVPPGTEPYAARLAPEQRPLRLSGALEVATREAAARRGAIADAIAAGDPAAALLTLAPLFERHDPVSVAAALYQLWTARGAPGPAAALLPVALRLPLQLLDQKVDRGLHVARALARAQDRSRRPDRRQGPPVRGKIQPVSLSHRLFHEVEHHPAVVVPHR